MDKEPNESERRYTETPLEHAQLRQLYEGYCWLAAQGTIKHFREVEQEGYSGKIGFQHIKETTEDIFSESTAIIISRPIFEGESPTPLVELWIDSNSEYPTACFFTEADETELLEEAISICADIVQYSQPKPDEEALILYAAGILSNYHEPDYAPPSPLIMVDDRVCASVPQAIQLLCTDRQKRPRIIQENELYDDQTGIGIQITRTPFHHGSDRPDSLDMVLAVNGYKNDHQLTVQFYHNSEVLAFETNSLHETELAPLTTQQTELLELILQRVYDNIPGEPTAFSESVDRTQAEELERSTDIRQTTEPDETSYQYEVLPVPWRKLYPLIIAADQKYREARDSGADTAEELKMARDSYIPRIRRSFEAEYHLLRPKDYSFGRSMHMENAFRYRPDTLHNMLSVYTGAYFLADPSDFEEGKANALYKSDNDEPIEVVVEYQTIEFANTKVGELNYNGPIITGVYHDNEGTLGIIIPLTPDPGLIRWYAQRNN